jgi:hypothetical protein
MRNESSYLAEWIIFQIVFGAAAGLPIGTLLPAMQAELSEADTATATGAWAVLRSFGTIWGIAIPSAIFNNQFAHHSNEIVDSNVRAQLANGQAYEHATKQFITTLPSSGTKTQVLGAYKSSLSRTWQVAIALCGVGIILVFLQREVTLRKELNTEFGLAERDRERLRRKLGEVCTSRRSPSSRGLTRARCMGRSSTVDSSTRSDSSQAEPVQSCLYN